jgi:hypothetical protein
VSERAYDIGVLYIPGIGPNDATEDLRRLTDAIGLWLDDWLSEGARQRSSPGCRTP